MQQLVLWFIFILLAGTLCLGAVAVCRLWSLERNEPQHFRGLCLLLAAFVLALGLRAWAVSPMHHVFYDEFNYLAEARNILCLGKGGQVLRGTVVDPELTSAPTSRVGFPALLALVAALPPDNSVDQFALAGRGERRLFLFNILLGALSVALVFRIAWRVSGDLYLAGWSAAALALLPAHIKYSASLSADTAVLFFFLLALMCLLEWSVLRQKLLILAALFAGAYSACIKPVYLPFLVAGLSAVIVPLYRRRELREGELTDILYYALCLLVPMAFILAPGTTLEVQSRSAPTCSWGYLQQYLLPNLQCLFKPGQFNVVLTLLAVVGMFQALWFRRNDWSAVMLLWFVLGFVLLSGYFAGGLSYRRFTDSDRFFFTVALPFSFLVALGARAVAGQFGSRGRAWSMGAGLAILALALVNAVYASRAITAFTTTRLVYQQLIFLQQVTPLLPADAYVVDPNSVFMAMATGKKTIRADLFARGDRPRRIVYFSAEDIHGGAPDLRPLEQLIRSAYDCRVLVVGSSSKEQGRGFTAYTCEKVDR